jgi:hypothetical protein
LCLANKQEPDFLFFFLGKSVRSPAEGGRIRFQSSAWPVLGLHDPEKRKRRRPTEVLTIEGLAD